MKKSTRLNVFDGIMDGVDDKGLVCKTNIAKVDATHRYFLYGILTYIQCVNVVA